MKYALVPACVVMQVCFGGLYAWSSFVPPLHSSHALSTTRTQLVFGSLIAVFTVSMVVAGRLLERCGPRLIAVVGGVLFGLGYLIASASGGSFPVLLVGIGVLAGIGTGFGYVCPLATCMKCFPNRKGLVTGIAVAGFGGGGVLLSTIAEIAFGRGIDVLTVFRWIGLCYGLAIVMAAMVLRLPEHRRKARAQARGTPGALLRDPFFLAMVLGMFCGTFAGLMVIGNLKSLALFTGVRPVLAAATVGVFAVGNAAGRIIWGWVADRVGERSISLSLLLLAISLGLLSVASALPGGVVGVSMLIGFAFGACFIVYAEQVSSRYGSELFGSAYPLVFLSYGLSGIAGPWIGGWLHDATASYTPGIAVSMIVVVSGLLASGRLLRKAREAEAAVVRFPATSVQ